MKVYCNVDLSNRSDERISFEYFLPASQSVKKIGALRLFVKSLIEKRFAHILIFNANLFYMLVCFLYKRSGGSAKVVFFDVLLKKPCGLKQSFIAKIKSYLMRDVDCFFSVHKDLMDYSKYYGIPIEKSRYVAFKGNNFEIKENYTLTDQGYILSCGVSHRDYKSLFKAVDGLDVVVKVVLPDLENIKFHKAEIDLSVIPSNVEIVKHDFNKESWNKILSGAKFVVIPISIDSIQPSGISVYLEAMMFKKPVIISDGPSTRGLVDGGQALVVERASVGALREAIQLLARDKELRDEYSAKGYAYAISLEGVDRLIFDIKAQLLALNGW